MRGVKDRRKDKIWKEYCEKTLRHIVIADKEDEDSDLHNKLNTFPIASHFIIFRWRFGLPLSREKPSKSRQSLRNNAEECENRRVFAVDEDESTWSGWGWGYFISEQDCLRYFSKFILLNF